MKLYNYINEICAISRKSGTGVMSDAIDHFMNNIADVNREDDQYHYPGMDGFDYAALVPYEEELRYDMTAMKLMVRKYDAELMRLYKAGKHDEAIALAKREFERVEAEQEAEGVDEEAK